MRKSVKVTYTVVRKKHITIHRELWVKLFVQIIRAEINQKGIYFITLKKIKKNERKKIKNKEKKN
jgi:hypothetical protein